MAFKYKIPSSRTPRLNVNRTPKSAGGDEIPLTGWVNGKQASDIEERFARALRKIGIPFKFQVDMPVVTSRIGEAKSLDFVVDIGLQQPVEIDGAFSHKSTAQKGADQMRDSLLNTKFAQIGWLPIKRIEAWKLDNQDHAEQFARNEIL